MMYSAFIALSVAAVLAWLIRRPVSIRVFQLKAAQDARDKFYARADDLISDDRTPVSVARLIHHMTGLITSRKLIWQFTSHLLKGRLGAPANVEPAVLHELSRLPREMQGQFWELAAFFMIAVTFNNVVLGWVWRRVILMAINHRPPQNSPQTVAVVEELAEHSPAYASAA